MSEKPRVVRRVEDAVDRATEPEHDRKYAVHDGPPRGVDDMVGEQQRESRDMSVAMTNGMKRGLVIGTILGGLIGAVVALPFAAIPFGLDIGWRILIVVLIGALAGSTAGAMYAGGRVPELEGETRTSGGRPDSGTSARDPRLDDRGRSRP